MTAYAPDKQIAPAELFTVPCDILIPAARPDCIHGENARRIQSRLIIQGANIPATAEAETILHERGVLIVPDFVANAGGVICAAVEHRGGSQADALIEIAEKIRYNTNEVLTRSRQQQVPPRHAASELARSRGRRRDGAAEGFLGSSTIRKRCITNDQLDERQFKSFTFRRRAALAL